MRYFEPRFQIATLMGEQCRLLSKIGGVPWGLPEELWPICCNRPQKLLAQLCHEPPMLDLGLPGSVLHFFQCAECDTIGTKEGGAFIVDQSILGEGLRKIAGYDMPGTYGGELIGEVWINGWKEHDDGIPQSRLPDFFDEQRESALQEEFSEVKWFDPRQMTKFGGSPRWTGWGPTRFPPSPFEFLLQLNFYLFIDGDPPLPDEAGTSIEIYSSNAAGTPQDRVDMIPQPDKLRLNAPWWIMHERGSSSHYLAYANYGSDGTAYVFIDRSRVPHRAHWFWNR